MVNEEGSNLHVTRHWNLLLLNISVEALIEELGSELRVEWTAVGDESASLSHITGESLLETLELGGVLDPPVLVVFKRVDESSGLVHLLLGLGSLVLESLLLLHGGVEFGLQASLELLDLLKLSL